MSPGFVAILDEFESALGLLYGDGVYDIEVWRLHITEGGRVICWDVRAVRRHDGHIRDTRLAPSRDAVRELVDRARRGAWGRLHDGGEADAWAPANVSRELPTRAIWPLVGPLQEQPQPELRPERKPMAH